MTPSKRFGLNLKNTRKVRKISRKVLAEMLVLLQVQLQIMNKE